MNENLTKRPPAGLSTVDYALVGVDEAAQKVVAVHSELGERPVSGLSPMKWGQMGLGSAAKKVREVSGESLI